MNHLKAEMSCIVVAKVVKTIDLNNKIRGSICWNKKKAVLLRTDYYQGGCKSPSKVRVNSMFFGQTCGS